MRFVYLAGPIFTQAEQQWMRELKSLIEHEAAQLDTNIRIVWPFELMDKDANCLTPDERVTAILQRCSDELDKAVAVIAVLDGTQVDDGTAWEIGYFFRKCGQSDSIVGIRTDFRSCGDVEGAVANSLISASCGTVFTSTITFKQALPQLLSTWALKSC